MGPVERNHLSHTIAEVRQRVDAVGPQIQQMLGSLQETTNNLREMSDSIRPAVESTVGHVEGMARTLNANSPRVETIIKHVEGVTREAEGYLVDNRENIKQTLASLQEFSGSINPDPGSRPSQDREAARRRRDIASPRRPGAVSGRPDRRPGFEHAVT